MIGLRDLICDDSVALEKWPTIVDYIVQSESDKLGIKKLLRKDRPEHHEAVLHTLNLWNGYGNKRADLLDVLCRQGLNTLAHSSSLTVRKILSPDPAFSLSVSSNFSIRATENICHETLKKSVITLTTKCIHQSLSEISGQGQPIQIYKMSRDTPGLNLEALERVLLPVQHLPVAFVSCNGVKRSGKSFLLNFLLMYLKLDVKTHDWLEKTATQVFPNDGQGAEDAVCPCSNGFSGFEWRGRAESHTVGIWIWSQPFIMDYRTSSGTAKEIAVILMDTEGSFDRRASLQDNSIVFAISVWLSAVFVYNVQNSLSQDKLSFLDHFSDFSNGLQEEALGEIGEVALGNVDNDNEEALFQHLLLLVRDWASPDDYNYGWHSLREDQQQVRNHVVDFLNGSSDSTAESVATINDIVRKFSDTSSFLLPHPGVTIHGRVPPTLPPKEKVEDDFIRHLQSFVVTVFERLIQPKIMFGEVKHGRDFLKLLGSWNGLLTSDKIPEVKDFNRAVADSHLEMAVTRAFELCQEQLVQLALQGRADAEFKAAADTVGANIIDKFVKECDRPSLARHVEKHLTTLQDLVQETITRHVQFNACTEHRQKIVIRHMQAQVAQMEAVIHRQETLIEKYKNEVEKERKRSDQDRRELELKLQQIRGSLDLIEKQHAREKEAMDEEIRLLKLLIEQLNRPPTLRCPRCVIL